MAALNLCTCLNLELKALGSPKSKNRLDGAVYDRGRPTHEKPVCASCNALLLPTSVYAVDGNCYKGRHESAKM